jgi:iron complex outermembrane receptor protein
MEAYTQLSYSHKESRTVIQPVPLSDQFILPPNHPLANQAPYFDPASGFGFNTFLLRSTSPHYPGTFLASQGVAGTPDLLIRYRSAGTGNRDFTDISDQTRVVLGVKGTARAWDYDANFLHVDTQLREKINGGYPVLTKILPLLNSGQVNPFAGGNTPAVQAQLDATQFHGDAYKTKTSLDGVQAKVSRDLTQLAGGPLALALGTEGRREGFKLDPAAELVTGDISGYGGNTLPVDRTRNVRAAFAELSVPIIRTVELTAAARYDDYQGTGSKTSPKLGARWQPIKPVLFRGSVGNGFRAPSLTDLYQPQTTGVTQPGQSDPLRCGVNPDLTRSCDTQFPITVGGKSTLKPETSKNATLGVVLEPTNNISLALDYWEVDLKNTIIFGITPETILADPVKYASLITRAAPDAACAGCPGQIVNIDQTNLNLGQTKVRGLDIDGRWRMPAAAMGTFTLSFNGTYISKYEIQNPDGSTQSINGMVSPIVQGNGGTIPRWRHYLYLDWTLKPWNVTFAQQYQSHYRDVPGSVLPHLAHDKVGEYQLFHLFASYSGLMKEQLRITLGIRNLFNKNPPYTNAGSQNYFQGGYDPGYADPRGRTFLLSATYKFL